MENDCEFKQVKFHKLGHPRACIQPHRDTLNKNKPVPCLVNLGLGKTYVFIQMWQEIWSLSSDHWIAMRSHPKKEKCASGLCHWANAVTPEMVSRLSEVDQGWHCHQCAINHHGAGVACHSGRSQTREVNLCGLQVLTGWTWLVFPKLWATKIGIFRIQKWILGKFRKVRVNKLNIFDIS
jgi:hypothetical protein